MSDEAGSDPSSSSSSSSGDDKAGDESSDSSDESEPSAKPAKASRPAPAAKLPAPAAPAEASTLPRRAAGEGQPAGALPRRQAESTGANTKQSAALKHAASNGKKKKRKGARHAGEDGDDFELSIDALQGRWRHSLAHLGMLNVRGDAVKFDSGLSFQLREIAPGEIDMVGWRVAKDKSTAEAIVWMRASDPAQICSWFLEDDLDRPQSELESIDSRNIIKGKRQRQKVDYRALERKIEEEEKQQQDVFSDASSDGGAAGSRGARAEREATETMSSKEWSEMHQRQSSQAAELFHKWMLSTCTSRHDEILRRKGKLLTRLQVALTGPGRKMLEKDLRVYGLKVAFRIQETVIIVDAAARQRFQERHLDEWRSAWQRLEVQEQAKRPQQAAVRAADEGAPAASAVAAPQAAPPPPPPTRRAPEAPEAVQPKRRKLRRIVADSDDEAPPVVPLSNGGVAEPAAAQAPEGLAEGNSSDALEAAWAELEAPGSDPAAQAADSSAVEAEAPAEDPAPVADPPAAPPAAPAAEAPELSVATSVDEAKARLEAVPPPSAGEASELLAFLEGQPVDAAVLAATKIGATVNRARKTYADNAAIVEKATALVTLWRSVWQQFQKEQKQQS